MKRKIAIFLMFAALLTSCRSKKNHLEEHNLKGKVWKLKETRYEGEEKFGKYQIGDKRYNGHRFYIFNEDGNLIELQESERVSKYTYDDSENCTEITAYRYDKVVKKRVNQVKNDKIVEAQFFDEDGKLLHKYHYNYSGAEISDGKIFNDDGSHYTFQNEFSSGLLSKQIVKDSLEEIISIQTVERNNEGDIITQKTKYLKDTSEYIYSFKYDDYDEKENWLKQYNFDEDGEIDDIIVRNIVYYDESSDPKTDKDFTGIWFVVDDNDWIEFRSDKKYDAGYKDRIKETGTWEIDSEQQILTFRADDPDDSRKYKYDFEGYRYQMILFTIQGEEKLRLEKR